MFLSNNSHLKIQSKQKSMMMEINWLSTLSVCICVVFSESVFYWLLLLYNFIVRCGNPWLLVNMAILDSARISTGSRLLKLVVVTLGKIPHQGGAKLLCLWVLISTHINTCMCVTVYLHNYAMYKWTYW